MAISRLPWLTVTLAAISGLLLYCGAHQAFVQYNRSAILTGEAWRIFTCHLTHWSASHFGWSAGTFVLLASVSEWQSRRRFVACCLVAGGLIPASLALCLPELQLYRGLSGLDSALFVMLAVHLLGQFKRTTALSAIIIAGLLCSFIAKLAFELCTSRAFFVSSNGESFAPVPLAHAVGGAVGALLARV
jgi:rhomboid family GlyGly-CTERM serine protease